MLSLQAAGKAFASPTSPPSNNESVEKDLEDLNSRCAFLYGCHGEFVYFFLSRWDALKCLVRTRRQLLSEALAKAKAFHEEWRQLNEGLSGMENKIYAEWVQHGLPEPCEADLTEHQVRSYAFGRAVGCGWSVLGCGGVECVWVWWCRVGVVVWSVHGCGGVECAWV